jgi:hypothetical protein
MRTCFCVLLVLLISLPAFGHELVGPTFAVADLQGHFAYNLTLTVTSTTPFGSTHLDGSDNTDVALWIDGFCQTTLGPGTTVIAVEGNLVNDGVNGSVVATVNLCDPWTGVATTTVVPFPVADQTSTWGTMKSLYR